MRNLRTHLRQRNPRRPNLSSPLRRVSGELRAKRLGPRCLLFAVCGYDEGHEGRPRALMASNPENPERVRECNRPSALMAAFAVVVVAGALERSRLCGLRCLVPISMCCKRGLWGT
jgi:hypothetical protein